MGRMYVSDEMMPAMKLLQKAYVDGNVSADDAYNMAYGMAYHKEENERKERSKENKEKEERLSLSSRDALKSSFVIPTVEEVQQYLNEIGETRFNGEDFCNYYEANGWMASEGCPLKSWKAMVRTWRKRERKATKGKDNVTHTNQQRQAAGTGAQAGQTGQAGQAEDHRRENMEKHLASHHPGDDRLAGLARQINEVAQEVGVSTAEYSLQQIAYDAQALLYKFVWCQGWTDERWREVMQQVARRLKKAAQPGQKAKLDSNALFEMVFGLTTRIRN